MMFILKAFYKDNEIEFNNQSPFTIVSFDGLEPPDAIINTNEISMFDGTTLNSVKVGPRIVNLSFVIEYDVERNRIHAYNVFQLKKQIQFDFEEQHRHVTFEGIVQSINVGYFEMKQTFDVSLYCPFPYFKNAQEVINEVNKIQDMFHFPFHSTESEPIIFGAIDTFAQIIVHNQGDVSCGLQFELYARNTVINPKVYNYVTQEFIGVGYTMVTGDLITIATGRGEKKIMLLRDGKEYNLFNAKMRDITWLQLETGSSVFIHEADTGVDNLVTTIRHTPLFGGV